MTEKEINLQQIRDLIQENTRDLIYGYNEGLISVTDMEGLLKEAELDEEYEVAISIRDVLKMINYGNSRTLL